MTSHSHSQSKIEEFHNKEALVGKIVHLIPSTYKNLLSFQVEITAYKNQYGRDRYLVKPIAGIGEAWVEEQSFSFIPIKN